MIMMLDIMPSRFINTQRLLADILYRMNDIMMLIPLFLLVYGPYVLPYIAVLNLSHRRNIMPVIQIILNSYSEIAGHDMSQNIFEIILHNHAERKQHILKPMIKRIKQEKIRKANPVREAIFLHKDILIPIHKIIIGNHMKDIRNILSFFIAT